MAKAKKRAKKYDPKLKIGGSFEDVIGASIDYTSPKKDQPKKQPKKKGN